MKSFLIQKRFKAVDYWVFKVPRDWVELNFVNNNKASATKVKKFQIYVVQKYFDKKDNSSGSRDPLSFYLSLYVSFLSFSIYL